MSEHPHFEIIEKNTYDALYNPKGKIVYIIREWVTQWLYMDLNEVEGSFLTREAAQTRINQLLNK